MLKKQLKEQKHLFATIAPVVILTLFAFIFAYQFVEPAPPRSFTIATGQSEGAYYQFALEYQQVLAREGVQLEILQSAGSVENIGLLQQADGVQAAFVQSGTGDSSTEGLFSLGSLYFEPLWVVYRDELLIDRINDLKGMRVAPGSPGSGTRKLSLMLLQDNDLEAPAVQLVDIGGVAAARALLDGEVDVALFVASPEAPLIQKLLSESDIQLLDFRRADAYARRHRFLSGVTLPEGVIDLKRNIPSAPIRLLAPTANLVVAESLHPALVGLLMQAMAEVHEDGGWFGKVGDFPQPNYLEFPLSDDAAHYYKNGPPFLQRYMPFWAATWMDRLKVMLLPLLVVLFPLFKMVFPLYRWRMRSRIYRWYHQLKRLSESASGDLDATEYQRLLDQLSVLEREVSMVDVPLPFAGQLYELRVHIKLVRGLIEKVNPQS
ncbi:MAG: TAXI family TRAP transporter solute-binding subunit [Gammaproteobacteria bacterium]|nr:TAXI family TRAP transporter solute-binding subunit [Gammaproteobacteria bacterium]